MNKFRAWDKGQKKMIDFNGCLHHICSYIEMFGKNSNPFDDRLMIWNLSSGFCDKKGVEIYHGDIVLVEDVYYGLYAAENGSHEIGKVFQSKSGEWQFNRGYSILDYLDGIEIIGNIFEIPELLP